VVAVLILEAVGAKRNVSKSAASTACARRSGKQYWRKNLPQRLSIPNAAGAERGLLEDRAASPSRDGNGRPSGQEGRRSIIEQREDSEYASFHSGTFSRSPDPGPDPFAFDERELALLFDPLVLGGASGDATPTSSLPCRPCFGVAGSTTKPGARAGAAERPGPAEARVLHLRDLCEVRALPGHGVQLTGTDGRVHTLPLGLLSDLVQDAIVEGLRTALPSGVASWSQLHEVTLEELWGRPRRGRTMRDAPRQSNVAAGKRRLEIFEVERWRPASKAWDTPRLPMDKELKWRWVDSSGKKHPSLRQGLSCKDAGEVRDCPPCEPFSKLFTPESDWEKEVHQGTDADGWTYSFAWKSSLWYPKPGLFDTFRKRRWTRTYA